MEKCYEKLVNAYVILNLSMPRAPSAIDICSSYLEAFPKLSPPSQLVVSFW